MSRTPKTAPKSKHAFLKQLESGPQQYSYWAGLRIQGPIAAHERKESDSSKLQTSWYRGGFMGPKH